MASSSDYVSYTTSITQEYALPAATRYLEGIVEEFDSEQAIPKAYLAGLMALFERVIGEEAWDSVFRWVYDYEFAKEMISCWHWEGEMDDKLKVLDEMTCDTNVTDEWETCYSKNWDDLVEEDVFEASQGFGMGGKAKDHLISLIKSSPTSVGTAETSGPQCVPELDDKSDNESVEGDDDDFYGIGPLYTTFTSEAYEASFGEPFEDTYRHISEAAFKRIELGLAFVDFVPKTPIETDEQTMQVSFAPTPSRKRAREEYDDEDDEDDEEEASSTIRKSAKRPRVNLAPKKRRTAAAKQPVPDSTGTISSRKRSREEEEDNDDEASSTIGKRAKRPRVHLAPKRRTAAAKQPVPESIVATPSRKRSRTEGDEEDVSTTQGTAKRARIEPHAPTTCYKPTRTRKIYGFKCYRCGKECNSIRKVAEHMATAHGEEKPDDGRINASRHVRLEYTTDETGRKVRD